MRFNKAFILSLLAAAVAVGVFTNYRSEAMVKDDKAPKKVLRHVVLFKFKKDAPKDQIDKVVTEFAALPSKIDTIIEFEKGTDVSVENKSKGFTHGFVVTFATAKGREIYLPHPAHKAFVKIVGPVLDDVLVFDYWAEK